MSNRIVIRVTRSGDSLRVLLDQGPAGEGDGPENEPLDLDPSRPPISDYLCGGYDRVEFLGPVGACIFGALCRFDPVREALQAALTISRSECRPILLRVGSDLADILPWEAICRAGGSFLALDGRWPIG